MCTNGDTLTNKMPKIKAYVEHHKPWIIAVTEIIPHNYQIPVQNAKLKISNSYDIPECISSNGRGIAIETHKDLDAKEISSQVASCWNGLPTGVVEAPVLAVF